MTYVRTIPEADAKGSLAAAYETVRTNRGAVANLYEALSLDPAGMEAVLGFQMIALHDEGPLTRRERELLAFVTSHVNKDAYAFTHHADAFSRYVTEPGLVARVAAGDYALLPKREAALAAFAERLAADPARTTAKDVEGLRLAGLRDEEIVAGVLVVSFVSAVNRVALGLGVGREDADRQFKY